MFLPDYIMLNILLLQLSLVRNAIKKVPSVFSDKLHDCVIERYNLPNPKLKQSGVEAYKLVKTIKSSKTLVAVVFSSLPTCMRKFSLNCFLSTVL